MSKGVIIRAQEAGANLATAPRWFWEHLEFVPENCLEINCPVVTPTTDITSEDFRYTPDVVAMAILKYGSDNLGDMDKGEKVRATEIMEARCEGARTYCRFAGQMGCWQVTELA